MRKLMLGKVFITPAAQDALSEAGETPYAYLMRHEKGDWGDVSKTDKKTNDKALENNERVVSVYHLPNSTKIMIITEWDRSITTILLASEY